MTIFFVPELAGANAERLYGELKVEAEVCTGVSSRDRRIEGVECRYRGVDRHIRVGEADGSNGMVVAAILQLGRDLYTIHHLQPRDAERSAPTVLQRTDVYSVTEFE